MSAQAFLGEANLQQARIHADRAALLLRGISGPRFLVYFGETLRIQAEVLASAGFTKAARIRMKQSLELLHLFGHAAPLADAYQTSARIRNNRQDSNKARELMEFVQS